MNIGEIQKIKFLNNLYRILYSSGIQPDEREVKKIFNRYFSINKFGSPVKIPYEIFRDTSIVDPNLLNQSMAAAGLNVEVLYDFLNQNNEDLYKIVTALNKRLNNLKTKRKKLEAKVDELLYANANSDGFFYSYVENFSSTDNIDMALTSALVDTDASQACIPQISSDLIDAKAPGIISASSISYSISFNGSTVVSETAVPANEIQNIFDGLNNTYASFSYRSNTIGIVSLTLKMAIGSSYGISKIHGTTLSRTPTSIYAALAPVYANAIIEERFKDGSLDYDKFSFIFPGNKYSNLTLIMYKHEPDEIIAGSDAPYLYNFGLRDLYVMSQYYDKNATVISKPISLPESDNANLSINSVSIDPVYEVVDKTDIKFFVAEDVDGAETISDFSWIPISPYKQNNNSYDKIINFGIEDFKFKFLDINDNINSLKLIPLTTEQQLSNPSLNIYPGLSVYKVAEVPENEQLISPYILSSINSYRRYFAPYQSGAYSDLLRWTTIIRDQQYTGSPAYLKDQTSVVNPGTWDSGSGFLETTIFCKEEKQISATVFKSDNNFDMAVYLNNEQIANIPTGSRSKEVDFNFVIGANSIIITYDKSTYGDINFSPIVGRDLSEFGDVYVDYYTYLNPVDFKNLTDSNKLFFTIDTINSTKYILSSKEIKAKSKIYYYDNNSSQISSIRFRIDLHRFDNPLATPVVDLMRVKFKHNE